MLTYNSQVFSPGDQFSAQYLKSIGQDYLSFRYEAPAPDYPPILPDLRRTIIVIDYDSGTPVEVKPGRATTLAMRWLVSFSRQRREKTMSERLMNEILDASNGLGAAVKRREDTHKMAEANRAFAHYRW